MTFQVGTGLSRAVDSVQAAQEAWEQASAQAKCAEPDWVLVFFSTEHMEQCEAIHGVLTKHCRCVVGCSTIGVLHEAQEVSEGASLVVMVGKTPGIRTTGFAHYQELEYSASAMQQVKETLERVAESSLLLAFPDAYAHAPYNLINTLNYTKTHPVTFGAGACNDGTYSEAVQVGPDGPVLSGVSGLALSGASCFRVGVTQSCVTMGEPMFVTKVEENQILKLDDFPALEVFVTVAAELGIRELETAAQHLLFSLPLDPEQPSFTNEAALVRSLSGVDVVSQGLELNEMVREGMVVSLAYRSPVTAEQDLRAMLERIRTEDPRTPAFGFYFNCAARGSQLYGRDNVDTEAIREILGEFPLIGCLGGYELATVPFGLQLYTYTGVLVLVYPD